ncbi:MAG TPA: GNAT family N-acetyltransferase [Lacipirellulaceae bacterium]|jgi:GNAT superfamily N-acetyltransferase|nr:GNAT family N-acetyltransferase [Lacipirellulaceae bacterium]
MNADQVIVVEADLQRSDYQEATVQLLNGYAMDPMGNGNPLPESVRQRLIPGLQQHPTTMVFLAYQADKPIGLAICFLGFSTFAARPLINIHDYFVSPSCRHVGVGRLLLSTIEARARELGCCKLTLEVQENNHRARRIYAAAGFSQAVYVSDAGGSLFLTRPL